MIAKITLILLCAISFLSYFSQEVSAEESSYIELRDVDRGTFNEYRYKITRDFFTLRDEFSVNGIIDENAANRILSNAKLGARYLPDNLVNDNNYNNLVTALRKSIKYPNNSVYYNAVTLALDAFIDKPSIKSMEGSIDAEPTVGNAPLVTTLRARVEDPNGTKISDNSYVWWIDIGGRRKVIGNKPSISYTFTQEGTSTVFLDVKSSHKNSKGYSDTLPYSDKIKIQVQEKVASVILRVAGEKVPYNGEIKFSPDEARYGVILDATSSLPSTGSKFLSTTWDFGNGVKKSYKGSPKIERAIYANEGEYNVELELKTNSLNVIKKQFTISVHKPIASIRASHTEGFLGDKFSFNAESRAEKNLSYGWEIINLEKDEIIFQKSGSLFSYSFPEKGRYSVRLKITDAAGNFDVDTMSIYINSKAPIANFTSKIVASNQPAKIYLDGTTSYDPDHSDDGNLLYSWQIDGVTVNLENPNANGSTGYYLFDTIGEHSIVLTVTDPDEITAVKKSSIKISSVLGVDFVGYPRVIQRDETIRFVANSAEAEFYEWDFGDGIKKGGSSESISHTYTRSGVFTVKLTVKGKDNSSNTTSKTVYIGNSKNPVAVIELSKSQGGFDFVKKSGVCDGKNAYIINRTNQITFSSSDSINTNGENGGIEVSWKLGEDKYSNDSSLSYKFSDLGCFPVKLTVKSINDKTTDAKTIWLKVENIKPQISGLRIQPVDIEADPVVINISAEGAKDTDGVIQSYLWYYTTDADTDAQDFRITRGPKTTFVLPKLPGNYHFGVVLKDNNEAKTNSKDSLGSNTLTLTGDNINTPLIELNTNDSSTSVGKEIVFTTKVSNVLGKTLTKDMEFSWDFDGDGFYDRKTEESSVTYKYKQSGTYYPKVRVQHKGFSNTKSITVDVANKLISDFSYISIGNKYIFLDQSKGAINSRKWDLGDGTERKNLSYIVHDYDDNKSVHNVELTVAEGTKTQTASKDVYKDVKSLLSARKPGLNVFSYPKVDNNGEIILQEEESIFIYLGESKGEISGYGIDFNIDADSDINGGKDDDIDNLNEKSYNNGEPQEIPLNNSRKQTIRVFLIDEDNATIDSKDITIIKEYIEEETGIDPSTLVFSEVSDTAREKIESIKNIITNFEQSDRIKGMLYLQKLQESWSDETEKTKTIIELETFLSETGHQESETAIGLLEEILLEGQDDKSEKNVAFTALKALIPEEIACDTPGEENCKTFLTQKLEEIKVSTNEETNRATGTEILDIISKDSSMSEKEKLDFKAILKILVYSGVDEIPEVEVEEVATGDATVSTDDSSSSEDGQLMVFLKKIGWWIAGFFIAILILMFIFWMLDFLKNRKSGESFSDFVEDKTSNESPLDEIITEQQDSVDPLTMPSEEISPLAEISPPAAKTQAEETTLNTPAGDIPDWLAQGESTETVPIAEVSTTNNTTTEKTIIEKTIIEKPVTKETSITDEVNSEFDFADTDSLSTPVVPVENTPSDDTVTNKTKTPNKKQHNKPSKQTITSSDESISTLDEITNIDDATSTPDWLKDSLTDQLPPKDTENDSEIVNEESLDTPVEDTVEGENSDESIVIEEDKEENLDLDNDMPDWLKPESGEEITQVNDDIIATEEAPQSYTERKASKEENKEKNISEPKKENKPAHTKTIKPSSNKTIVEKEESDTKVLDIAPSEPVAKKEEIKSDSSIPDWLQGSLDETKEEKKKEAEQAKKDTGNQKIDTPSTHSKPTTHLSDTNVPDWLKESLTEEVLEKEEKKKKEKASTPDKDVPVKNPDKNIETSEKTEEKPKKSDELWDDGMDVPDWLKTDNDK